MAILFNCPHCDAAIKVPDSAAGKPGRCPSCQTRLRVPDPRVEAGGVPEQPPAAAETPVQQTPVAPAAPIQDEVAPQREAASADDEAPVLSAREEFSLGLEWMKKPVVPGAGWPAADRAATHFARAAQLEPGNADYATHAGNACQTWIARFLESWGTGPLVSIAAFHAGSPLGDAINKSEQLFRPSTLTTEVRQELISKANEGLRWYSQALSVLPDDPVTLSRRARLLVSVGAFAAALRDAAAVLASPLAPSSAKAAAQEVTDFILDESSPLHRFLTRTEAQLMEGPAGIEVPEDKPAVAPAPAVAPPAVDDEELPPIFVPGEGPGPVTPFGEPVAADGSFPIASEAALMSIAAQLKRKRSSWGSLIAALVCAIVLLAAGAIYLRMTRPLLRGELTAIDASGTTLKTLIPRSSFPIAEDRLNEMLATFRDNPVPLNSQYRHVLLSGNASGLQVTVTPGPHARLIKVDLRTSPELVRFLRENAAALQQHQQEKLAAAYKTLSQEWANASAAGMDMGNLASYVGVLGGDALTGGFGYHTVVRYQTALFQCVFEDADGLLYYLVPKEAQVVEVIEREFEGRDPVFADYEFGYTVTIPPARAAPPPEVAPQETPAEEPEEEPESPGMDEGAMPAESTGELNPDGLNALFSSEM